MAFVVTGAPGSLGRSLVERLRPAGHAVAGVHRRPAPRLGAAHLPARVLGSPARTRGVTDVRGVATR